MRDPFEDELKIVILNNEVYLDHECWHCSSRTEDQIEKDENGKCKYCDGVGFYLTDLGKEFIDFIKRYKHLL